MNSLVGKTISALLCGLVLMGQSAAWIHIATCEGYCDVSALPAGASSGPSHDGCGHHHGHGGLAVSTHCDRPEGPSSSPLHSHDSDDCVVCQSLAWAAGEVVSNPVLCTGDALVERQVLTDSPWVESFSTSLPHLRGPPIS
ncbi:hypothetical protein CKO51_07560 [Rhodopirellula sp. SM50]|nr:hypothetical protein [Rhodopirellula sp. SM50]PAY20103.1 hypothetical protein CKO51_07560 [Rhodopirellula sp. SM50]